MAALCLLRQKRPPETFLDTEEVLDKYLYVL